MLKLLILLSPGSRSFFSEPYKIFQSGQFSFSRVAVMRSVSLVCWTWGWQLSGLPAGEGGRHTGDGGSGKLAPDQTARSGKIIFSFFSEGHLQAVRKNNF